MDTRTTDHAACDPGVPWAPGEEERALAAAGAVRFRAYNPIAGLEDIDATFGTLCEALDYETPRGGPTRVVMLGGDGRWWWRGGYADRAPQWFGPYPPPVTP